MKQEDLFEAVGQVDEALIQEAAQKPAKKFTFKPHYLGIAAGVCALAVGWNILTSGFYLGGGAKNAAAADTAPQAAPAEGNYGYSFNSMASEEAGVIYDSDAGLMMTDDAKAEGPQMDPAAGQKIIYTATLELESADYDGSLTQLSKTLAQMGGYLESSNEGGRSEYKNRWYEATLRVPSDHFNGFLTAAGEIGNLQGKTLSSENVTLNYVDLSARVSSLETQRDRLNELAAKAESVEDLIYIQDQLSQVEYQLESYASQLRVLENQVSMSTVHFYLYEVSNETPVEVTFGQKIINAFGNGWRWFVQDVQDVILDILRSWPGLVILAVLLFAGFRFWKKRRQKSRE